jgi:hypothetical protein
MAPLELTASSAAASDEDFLRRFEDTSHEGFDHRSHVRMCWLYVRRHGADGAIPRVVDGIRRYATAKGAADKYHHTLTLLWVRLVAAAVRATPALDGFDAFYAAHPHLAEKGQAQRFYTEESLGSPAARAGWVEPDLQPLP